MTAATLNGADPVALVTARLAQRGCDPRPTSPDTYEARCPAHDGSRHNLSVSRGDDGRALVCCHHSDERGRGCTTEAIAAALDLKPRDLFPYQTKKSTSKAKGWRDLTDAVRWIAKKDGCDPTFHWLYTEDYAVARFDGSQGKTYRPFHRDPESGRWRIGDPKGKQLPLYRGLDLAGASGRIWIVEGEKCAELARSLGLLATTTAHGAKSPQRADFSPVAGKETVILPDLGDAGESYRRALIQLLLALDPPARVKTVRLPGLVDDGDDIEQWLEQRQRVAAEAIQGELEQLAEAAPWDDVDPAWAWEAMADDGMRKAAKRRRSTGKPEIIIGRDDPGEGLEKWTGAALGALAESNKPPTLFQRAGGLVRLRRIEADAPVSIERLTLDALRGILDRAACWAQERTGKGGEVYYKYGPPPMEVVKDVAALPAWEPDVAPRLDTVIESPRYLPDRTLITSPGYHAEGRVYYDAAPELAGLVVPDSPTNGDVQQALSLLFDDLLVDFPFAEPASKANALGVMLLPFVRTLIDGPTPLHMFESSTEGVGKGLLAFACAFPCLGREPYSTPQKEDEAEWRKALTTAFVAGHSHIFIDNLYNPRGWDDCLLPIDSAVLASALTQPYWRDRILGVSEDARVRVQCVWLAAGNNIEWSRELTRRVVPIRLKSPCETPSDRTGFKHDLIPWARENRVNLLRACLTLCQRWIREGCPAGEKTMGSYESYAKVIGGILDVAGVPAFLSNRKGLKAKDHESARWIGLAKAWNDNRGMMPTSIANLYDLMFGRDGAFDEPAVPGSPELQVAFADVLGEGKPMSQKQRLGHAIKKQEDRVYDGWRIIRCSATAPNGTALYRLAPSDEQGDEDDDPVPF